MTLDLAQDAGRDSRQGLPKSKISFFHGDRTRILIATVIFCFAFLELLWFGAALSSVLRDAGLAGWGTAATASSAALGAILFFRMAVRAGLALSIADLGHVHPHQGSPILHLP